MTTKSALVFYLHPSPGVAKSLLYPNKRVIAGVFKHTTLHERLLGSSKRNVMAIEREIGKYQSVHIRGKKADKLIEGIFGRKHKGRSTTSS